jgi:hypothetical protein
VAIGAVLLVPVSTAFAGAGIPLWVVGAQSPRAAATPSRLAQSPQTPWFVPSVVPAGPRGAALRWTF